MAEGNKIKKFVDKKVKDWKFRNAGEGHSLSEEKGKGSISSRSSTGKGSGASRPTPSHFSHGAGSAAIARFENKDRQQQQSSRNQKSRAAMVREMREEAERSQASKDMEVKEQEQQQPSPSQPKEVDVSCSNIAVHFTCPVCRRSIPRTDITAHLASCLQEEVVKEPLTGSLQMIISLCEDEDRRKACLDTLTRYLDNVLSHPGEEKYRKIRVNNKAFQERVASVPGAMMFLETVGFQQQLLSHQDSQEQFLVISEEAAKQCDQLQVQKELLSTAQPLHCEVDRNLQVFQPTSKIEKFNLPDDFFNLTADEVKREQKMRSEEVDRSGVLRTKIMRERDEVKMAVRHYKFVVIRVRMPDGLIVQGIFKPLEKLSDVRSFVSEVLVDQTKTFSFSMLGKPFRDEQLTLAALNMVPSAVLFFTWDGSPAPAPPYLTPDVMARVQEFQ